MSPEAIDVWRKIIVGDTKSWVVFEQGTCVIFPEPVSHLVERASELLSDWGAVGTKNPVSDFRAVKLTKDPGWVVACRQPNILTYIGPADLSQLDEDPERIGLLGRGRRYADAVELRVAYVEDRNGPPSSSNVRV